MVILGLDPGTTRIGFGLAQVRDNELSYVEHGTWEAASETDQPERLCILYQHLTTYLHAKRPAAAAVERLFFGRATTQMLNIVEARGVIVLACAQAGVPVFSYPPQTIKAALLHGRASKKEIQHAVAQYFELAAIPKPDDAADALAATICHYQHHPQHNPNY